MSDIDTHQTWIILGASSTIAKAAQYYLAKNNVDEIPASGVGVDRYERTLMGEALLRDVSTYHDLQIDGSVVSPGDPCP